MSRSKCVDCGYPVSFTAQYCGKWRCKDLGKKPSQELQPVDEKFELNTNSVIIISDDENKSTSDSSSDSSSGSNTSSETDSSGSNTSSETDSSGSNTSSDTKDSKATIADEPPKMVWDEPPKLSEMVWGSPNTPEFGNPTPKMVWATPSAPATPEQHPDISKPLLEVSDLVEPDVEHTQDPEYGPTKPTYRNDKPNKPKSVRFVDHDTDTDLERSRKWHAQREDLPYTKYAAFNANLKDFSESWDKVKKFLPSANQVDQGKQDIWSQADYMSEREFLMTCDEVIEKISNARKRATQHQFRNVFGMKKKAKKDKSQVDFHSGKKKAK